MIIFVIDSSVDSFINKSIVIFEMIIFMDKEILLLTPDPRNFELADDQILPSCFICQKLLSKVGFKPTSRGETLTKMQHLRRLGHADICIFKPFIFLSLQFFSARPKS